MSISVDAAEDIFKKDIRRFLKFKSLLCFNIEVLRTGRQSRAEKVYNETREGLQRDTK